MTAPNIPRRPGRRLSKHPVFYRPLPENRGVEIVRLIHGARDLEALFAK